MMSASFMSSKASPMPPANTDCYFYYYSSCAKGSSCPYRHEPTALAQEVVCTFWRQGTCTVSDGLHRIPKSECNSTNNTYVPSRSPTASTGTWMWRS